MIQLMKDIEKIRHTHRQIDYLLNIGAPMLVRQEQDRLKLSLVPL
jgi:hypothetical protein